MCLPVYRKELKRLVGKVAPALLLDFFHQKWKEGGNPIILQNPADLFGWTKVEWERALHLIAAEQEYALRAFETIFTIQGVFQGSRDFLFYEKDAGGVWSFEFQAEYFETVVTLVTSGKWRGHIRSFAHGFVYVIETEAGYKIGQTLNATDRCQSVMNAIPMPAKLVTVIPTVDRHSLERTLHTRYHSRRIKGEWFRLSPEDVSEILNHANQTTPGET